MLYKLLATILVVSLVTLATGPGCSSVPPSVLNGGTLTEGEERSGSLNDGQVIRFTFDVKNGHRYAVFLTGSAGTIGLPDFILSAEGDPLEEGLTDTLLGLIRPEIGLPLLAEKDGKIQIQITNRTEGLVVDEGLLTPLLFGDLAMANYRIRVDDLGLDDHGRDPSEATQLTADGEATEGTLVYGKDYDFFSLDVVKDRRYTIKLEASGTARIATGEIDRFDEFNFGVSSEGGTQFNLQASSGSPTTRIFTGAADETVLIGVAADPDTILEGIIKTTPPAHRFPVQYAITVEELSL